MFYCLSVMTPVEEGRDLSMRLSSKFILAVAVLLTLVVLQSSPFDRVLKPVDFSIF